MKHPITIFGAIIFAISWGFSYATEQTFIEGKHYQRAPHDISDNDIVKDLVKENRGRAQVVEFFSYGCSWCFKLDPALEKWEKNLPSDVSFQRIPVEFQPAWSTLTKAYYTVVALKANDKVHTPLFSALHTDKMNTVSEASLRQFFIEHGIKEQDFNKTFESFDVTRKQKWANTISRAYRITAVPALIVQGPAGIFITTVRMAGGQEELFQVLDYLLKLQQDAFKEQLKDEQSSKQSGKKQKGQ